MLQECLKKCKEHSTVLNKVCSKDAKIVFQGCIKEPSAYFFNSALRMLQGYLGMLTGCSLNAQNKVQRLIKDTSRVVKQALRMFNV